MNYDIMNQVLMDAVSRNDVPGVQQAINNGIDMISEGLDGNLRNLDSAKSKSNPRL